MEGVLSNLQLTLGQFIPNLLVVLAILLIGWLVALVLSAVVRRVMEGLNVDERLNQQTDGGSPLNLTDLVSRGVFWLTLLFAIVAALDRLQLGVIVGPFNNILVSTVGFIPRLIGAAVLALVAFLVATVLRRVIEGALNATNLDERLARNARMEQRVPLSKSLSTLAYWLVWLLFLPAILESLGMQGLLAPVQTLVQDILAFLPNLLSAAVILVVGYFVARIVRDIVTNLLASAGADRIAERVGFASATEPSATAESDLPPMAAATAPHPSIDPSTPRVVAYPEPGSRMGSRDSGPMTLSKLLGTVVFALILIPVAITALDALNLDALSEPATAMLQRVLNAIPAIFAAAILLAVAYFAARLIGDLVSSILAGVGFDRILTRIGLRNDVTGGRQPSEIVGNLILVGIMLFAAAEAANLLGFAALAGLITQFLLFFGNVLLGLVVLGLGLFLANLADQTIRSSNVQNSDLLARVARYSIIILSITMALRQMGIAEDIVMLAFGLMLGSVAVAAALAFGLGGREVAARELNNMVSNLRNRPEPPANPPRTDPGTRGRVVSAGDD